MKGLQPANPTKKANLYNRLCVIGYNLCVYHFRKIKNKPVIRNSEGADIFELLNFEETNAEEKLIKGQSGERIMKLVAKLPEEQREVIILRHFADLKFREISKILDCSVNTTLGRMRYALLNLRKIIEENKYHYKLRNLPLIQIAS